MKGRDVTVTVVAVGKATDPRAIRAEVFCVLAHVDVDPQSWSVGWLDTVRLATGVVLVIENGAVPVTRVEVIWLLVVIGTLNVFRVEVSRSR